jgi:hypothetical protein
MADVDQATATQLANIQKKTGKSLDELHAWLQATGLSKHGELRDAAKSGLGLGHGDANTLVTIHLRSTGASAAPAASGDVAADEIYSGLKAPLRPVHDRVMEVVGGFGPFEIAPKKGYVSLRRKKQFAMVGPATKTQVEVGINARGLAAGERLVELPAGQMCQYKVRIGRREDVDEELIGWLRAAYDAAG